MTTARTAPPSARTGASTPAAATLAEAWAGIRRPVIRRDFPMTWVADDVLLIAGPQHSAPVRCDRNAAAWVRGIDGSRTAEEVLAAVEELPADLRLTIARVVRTAATCGIVDDAALQPQHWRWMSPPQRRLIEPDLLAAHHVYGSAASARAVIDRRVETIVGVDGCGTVAAAVRAALLESGMRIARTGSAAITVLCEPSPPDVVTEFGTPEQRRIHLPVGVFGAQALVGPLVVPGRSSCLRCTHLHHCDIDASWSLRSAQLALLAPSLTTAPVDRLLAQAAATLALALVRAWVDEPDEPDDELLASAYELRLPLLVPRRVHRPTHPLCGCQWPAE